MDRLRKIKQATLPRKIEHTKRARDAKASVPGYPKAIPLIDQQQVGVQGFCQGDGCGFSFVQTGHSWHPDGVVD